MKKIAKMLSCLTAFSVLTAVPALPAQAEAPAYTFTAEDIQRNLDERNFTFDIRDIDEEKIQATIESLTEGGSPMLCNDAATCVISDFAGIAFVWHGEGTPQGEKFGDYQPEWSESYVSSKPGEPLKMGTAAGYLSVYGYRNDPNWPNLAYYCYSWTEPTEITQYPETIYLAGGVIEYNEQQTAVTKRSVEGIASALMADERVEIIGLMYGINRRSATWGCKWEEGADAPKDWHDGGFTTLAAIGYNFTAELVPVQHDETVPGRITAEDVQRTYDTHSCNELRGQRADKTEWEYAEYTMVTSDFAGIAFVWHGEGTPQGETFGDYQPEWSDGYVTSKAGETPKIGTAEGFLSVYGYRNDPDWPNPKNIYRYSWTEPTGITQYPETIYLAGSIDRRVDTVVSALLADERVEIIGLMYGINTRPAPDGMYDELCGYDYSAELIPIQHFGNTRGDFDGDSAVALNDVVSALELYSLSQMGVTEPTAEQLEIADIDGSGTLDLTDVICILQYYNYNEVLGVSVSWEDILANKV